MDLMKNETGAHQKGKKYLFRSVQKMLNPLAVLQEHFMGVVFHPNRQQRMIRWKMCIFSYLTKF
jgi:hypothetical protein